MHSNDVRLLMHQNARRLYDSHTEPLRVLLWLVVSDQADFPVHSKAFKQLQLPLEDRLLAPNRQHGIRLRSNS